MPRLSIIRESGLGNSLPSRRNGKSEVPCKLDTFDGRRAKQARKEGEEENRKAPASIGREDIVHFLLAARLWVGRDFSAEVSATRRQSHSRKI
jgi:hypothetical protein